MGCRSKLHQAGSKLAGATSELWGEVEQTPGHEYREIEDDLSPYSSLFRAWNVLHCHSAKWFYLRRETLKLHNFVVTSMADKAQRGISRAYVDYTGIYECSTKTKTRYTRWKHTFGGRMVYTTETASHLLFCCSHWLNMKWSGMDCLDTTNLRMNVEVVVAYSPIADFLRPLPADAFWKVSCRLR